MILTNLVNAEELVLVCDGVCLRDINTPIESQENESFTVILDPTKKKVLKYEMYPWFINTISSDPNSYFHRASSYQVSLTVKKDLYEISDALIYKDNLGNLESTFKVNRYTKKAGYSSYLYDKQKQPHLAESFKGSCDVVKEPAF